MTTRTNPPTATPMSTGSGRGNCPEVAVSAVGGVIVPLFLIVSGVADGAGVRMG